jgi:hypothetical protein
MGKLQFGVAHSLVWLVLASPLLCRWVRNSFQHSYLKKKEIVMRSDLVFKALSHVSNRYQLCTLASKATRKLHKPNTRLQDTTNEVLGRFEVANPEAETPEEAPAVHHPVERRRAA